MAEDRGLRTAGATLRIKEQGFEQFLFQQLASCVTSRRRQRCRAPTQAPRSPSGGSRTWQAQTEREDGPLLWATMPLPSLYLTCPHLSRNQDVASGDTYNCSQPSIGS